jgi:hypothetical protein
MRPRPGCGPLSREVGFPSVGPPMADPSVQFPESRFSIDYPVTAPNRASVGLMGSHSFTEAFVR